MGTARRVFIFPFALALLAMASPAFATDVCTVQKGDDGAIVLRAEASDRSEELARANPGEALVIQKSDDGEQIADGDWLKVFHYPGEIIPDAADPEYRHGKTGWMLKRFVGDCG